MDDESPNVRKVAVVGGGVSGLAVAWEIAERSQRLPGRIEVTCFESGDRPGGNIRSEPAEGFLCEWGPNGFLDNAPATLTLVRRLGLAERLQPADASSAVRFIFRDGRLRRVPTTPGAFLRSDILPLLARLRVCAEPLAPRGRAADESVFDFASRRIGRAAAAVLVDAMVSGIYAGDVRRLSLEATFPRMRKMERDHGSLFRALLAKRKQARESGAAVGGPAGPAGHLTSFRGGMQELTDALARGLGSRLRTRTAVQAISDLGRRGFRLHMAEGAPLDVDAVVVACPAWHAAPMVRAMDPALGAVLAEIPPAPLAVVHCGYREGALGEQHRGFGFLVPRGQGPRILGTLWSSDIFPGRAPEGSRLITSMIGGAHDPGILELDDAELVRLVRVDLERTMGIATRPYAVRVFRHPRGIPQYVLGHPERLKRIQERIEARSGLWLSGNSYRGISVNACVEEAPGIAESVLDQLSARRPTP